MRIAVLGTGSVGRALAGRWSEAGHDVVVGTRDPAATLARADPGWASGTYAQWQEQHPDVRLLPFADAGEHAELVVNATAGTGSVQALAAAGAGERPGRVIVDVANPLDTSTSPPTLTVVNTDSLGEQIQRAFPDNPVVKTLNTMNNAVMVDRSRVPGPHTVFVAGDDADAKRTVVGLLHDLGWDDDAVLDLGGIMAARGCEMYLPLWLQLVGALGTADLNIEVRRAPAQP